MRAVIRSISTIDGNDPRQFRPSDESFSVVLRLIVGPADSEGEESFDVEVCSPMAVLMECERYGFAVGRHRLIVNDYNFTSLQRILEKLIERCDGNTWQQIAEKIGRIGYWEFEDYRPSHGSPLPRRLITCSAHSDTLGPMDFQIAVEQL